MSQIIEVWAEDNYDFMKGESHPCKIAEFHSTEEAVAYMCAKLDEQLYGLAKNVASAEELLSVYKYGGVDYFIKDSLLFSSWEYAEQVAQKIFEEVCCEK
ncbi:hypothetical protein ACM66Z_07060 [Sulfurovum sp. ST-21]|uniref:Uncharacterized protein n=1 Tax=Sulfurovum indicum TaxID=2779528 RepID=A0A7M1S2B7_9BACT|nr:hypothetical protein [Sulfurovum indicum]QOR61212.1 hypothetical protein IMZ28_07060 [Sulfurovum indicum]